MAGIVFLLLALLTGYCINILWLPELFSFTKVSYKGLPLKASPFLIIFPASMLIGTLILSWLTYILALAFSSANAPLKIANIIVFLLSIVFIAFVCKTRIKTIIKFTLHLFDNIKIMDIIMLVFSLGLALYLMIYTFYYKENSYWIGYTVYSDFAVHLDMIRSFSHGNNFPTWYSHFAGTDIKYHFMYQFLVGNLEFLGLRLDLAYNIPSVIFFVTTCMLLYLLTVKLFEKKLTGFLAIILFSFRSSSSLLSYLGNLTGTFEENWNTFINNCDYIGITPNEAWGLYDLNVYANQRHLAMGLTTFLLAVIILLPRLFAFSNTEKGFIGFFKTTFVSKEAWLPKEYRLPIATGIIIGLTGFFNGACVIGCLLVLFFLAIPSARKLEYAMTAGIAVILSSIQSNTFIDGSVVSFRWEPGYIAEVKTLFGTLWFVYMLLGLFCIMLIFSAVFSNGRYRWVILSFISPIIFALTFQMTRDASVNHKYVMMGYMLGVVFIAEVISVLITNKDIFIKTVAGFLIIAMTMTGVYELIVFHNRNNTKNNGSFPFDRDNPVTVWLMENTDSRDLILCDAYSMSQETIAGIMMYYGWSYYAWSAGYDTEYRQEQTRLMFESGSREELMQRITENDIDFIIVDYFARNSIEYNANEAVIADTYECVFTTGEGDWIENIYDTSRVKP